MTSRRAEDILWVAEEVADLATLLHSHGLTHLASRLDQVQSALQSMHTAAWRSPLPKTRKNAGKIVVLQSFRTQLQSTVSNTEGDARETEMF
jgi:hypothetical protein